MADALEWVRQLERTVDRVLALSRPRPDEPMAVRTVAAAEIVLAAESRWHGALARSGRRVTVESAPEAVSVLVPRDTTAQIVDVLVDNATRHGAATVSVTTREVGAALAIDVSDEGALGLASEGLFERGTLGGGGQGIGLALAATLPRRLGASRPHARSAHGVQVAATGDKHRRLLSRSFVLVTSG